MIWVGALDLNKTFGAYLLATTSRLIQGRGIVLHEKEKSARVS